MTATPEPPADTAGAVTPDGAGVAALNARVAELEAQVAELRHLAPLGQLLPLLPALGAFIRQPRVQGALRKLTPQ